MNYDNIEELDEEEREFLKHHSGGVFEILNGTDRAPHREAMAAVDKLVDSLGRMYPSRTERLLVLTAITEGATRARDEVLDEIIASRYHWRRNNHSGEWCALAWEAWEKRQLASLANSSARAINSRVKRVLRESLEAAGLKENAS